ncbi:hypothetical protein B0T20DRAFT_413917 [Sordaria brevicollis]|uniref:Uncharacterized protein n=1 Tax=Sordaria brevicollis TaxID=83679 RepID=A0AAE0PDL0_SORBR|nr:hypothetical protein B0T20DRAFT_413917 [Sordaria brevicollis]
MRQLVLIAPAIVRGAGGLGQDVQATTSHHGGGERHAPKTVWNNMGLLNEMIGGGTQSPLGRAGTNLYQQQPQPRQETHIHPRPELGSSRDYNFVLPPPYPGPEAKQQPVLRPSPSSISVLSSTTLWNASTDPDPAFKELPGAITQPTSTNPPTRPPHATHKPSSSSSATVFDTMGLGLMYSDYGFGPSPGFGLSHDQKPSSSTSTPAKSAELPGFREPGELPATTTTRNTNTLIYNHHQHTTHSHNHNYQCHHHHYHQHHRHTNNNNPNYRGNQMEGVRIQHQHPQQQQQSAGGGGHHTCNYAWEQQQRNNNIWSGPAINEGQPQELSSVVFAPDPVELP